MALSRALRDSMRGENGIRRDKHSNGLYENNSRQRHAAGDMVQTEPDGAPKSGAPLAQRMRKFAGPMKSPFKNANT